MQCRPLYRRLTRTNLTPEERKFLNDSQCNRDDITVNVRFCCPNTYTIDDLPSVNQCGLHVPDKIIGGVRNNLTDFPW